jgi:hypothetical protein
LALAEQVLHLDLEYKVLTDHPLTLNLLEFAMPKLAVAVLAVVNFLDIGKVKAVVLAVAAVALLQAVLVVLEDFLRLGVFCGVRILNQFQEATVA